MLPKSVRTYNKTEVRVWTAWLTVPFLGTLENSADPDETPQNAASDHGLHCLLTWISIKNKIKMKSKTGTGHLQMIRIDKPARYYRVNSLMPSIFVLAYWTSPFRGEGGGGGDGGSINSIYLRQRVMWEARHEWVEPPHEKTCLRGLRPGKPQIGLLGYRD